MGREDLSWKGRGGLGAGVWKRREGTPFYAGKEWARRHLSVMGSGREKIEGSNER